MENCVVKRWEDDVESAFKEGEEFRECCDEIIKEAEETVEEINAPKGVEVPKEIDFKDLNEKLILPEREILTEGAAEENAMYELKEVVTDEVEKILSDSMWDDNLAYVVASIIPEYDVEWCSQDAYDSVSEFAGRTAAKARKAYCKAVTDLLFAYAPKELSESLNEDLIITSSLANFKPWSGAVDTWNKIEKAGKINELDALLEDIYPEGLDETSLNDLLWFDPEWILESLGLEVETEE